MSLENGVPQVTQPASEKPDDYTCREMADLTATKKVIVMYERQIQELKESRDYFQAEVVRLQAELKEDHRFKVDWANLKRGKTETVVSFMIGSVFSGLGGLGMGIWPRSEVSTSPQFIVSACLVGFGVFLGLVARPITLLICYKWPNYCSRKHPPAEKE